MFKKKYKFFSIIISTVILITYLFKDIILISNNNLIEEEEYTVSHYIKFFKTIPYLADKISKQNEQLLTYKHLINYDINLFTKHYFIILIPYIQGNQFQDRANIYCQEYKICNERNTN